ncbi:hypothetical protein ACFQ2O_03500 [Pontibacter rugosus]|uniref:Uncharacterized protein n=1 Tax=Pontibacter rugosus TaxID=1745966 RepID=A0ABW3SKA3_9BACT
MTSYWFLNASELQSSYRAQVYFDSKNTQTIKEKTVKLRERFPKLQDEAFVRSMVIKSVYGSMMLEDQEVSKQRLEQLYTEVKSEKQAKAA